ncbi:oligosaccharide flippase family protein [Paenibacillus sp. A3]|uniref:oligosaccharide flippase family protein n=1 Tax=Paenibacillus sp. A3 TaxID=1337054 RepID=UPI0006D55AA0|nr:oligosaccharide flippase family protein [Paenibacillus sp. A3]
MNSFMSLFRKGLDISNVYGLVKSLFTRKDSTASSISTVTVTMLIFLLNLITGILTARYLGPVGKGELSAMTLWFIFLAGMLMLGLPSALLFNLKKRQEDSPGLYVAGVLLCLATGCAALLIGFTGIPYWLHGYSPEVVRYAQWFMLASPVLLLEYINNSVLQARGEFTLFNKLRILPHIGTVLILLVLIFTNKLTPFSGAVAYALPTIPVTLGLTVRLLWRYLPRLKQMKQSVRHLVSYSLRSSGVDVMGTLIMYMDQVVVIMLLSPSNLGLYLVAVSLAKVVNVIQTSLALVVFPKASGLPKEEAIELVKKVFRISVFVTLIVALFFMFIGPLVLNLLYGSQYHEAVSIFRILLLEVVIGGGTLILSQAFMSVGKPGICSIQQVIGLSVSIVLMVLLVPRYGLLFTGISLLTATCIRFVFILSQYKFTLKTTIPRLLITRDDIRWLLRQVNLGSHVTKQTNDA